MWFEKRDHTGFWKKVFFLRLLLPLISGMLTEYFLPVPAVHLIPVFCLSLVLLIICHLISFSKFFGMEWMVGIVIQIVFFSFGRIGMQVHEDKTIEQSSCFTKNHPNRLLLQVLSDPVQKKNSHKCIAIIRWLLKDQTFYYESEKILVYFNKDQDALQITEGSWILTEKKLQPIENFRSFHFDFKKYCRLKHIHAQVFLNENDFSIIPHEKEKSFFTMLDSLRKKLLLIIKAHVPGKTENSLLEALMVGYTQDLEPELLKSYADTGVIHIIAISGLHLALICHILQFVLQKTGQKKSMRWIKLILIVAFLWGYSLLSGASPSVIRAAGMFSLILFARSMIRETALFNTLAASAFLLLCFDPYWIFDTGFQLSYAAVLSLGLFAKPFRKLLSMQNKILSAIWDAASVSLAAQILTTPISIYYFHRFPSYFLVANLMAVPLSSGILVGGILLCLCAFLPPLAHPLGWILGVCIHFLNGFIGYISGLPGAVISDLSFSLPALIGVYFIIFCFYRFLMLKEKIWLLAGLSAISIIQMMGLIG
jgi:competence protein ComEC